MRELLVKTNNEKRSLIVNAPTEDIYFSKEKLNEIYSEYDEIIKHTKKVNSGNLKKI